MMIQKNIFMITLLMLGVIVVMLVVPVASGASVTRDLPDTIDPGAEFDVVINVSVYGIFGQITETLCPGWSYLGSSLDPVQIAVDGDEVTFTLLGETGFTYSVKAPDNESSCCVINGILVDEDKNSYDVGGDLQVYIYGGECKGDFDSDGDIDFDDFVRFAGVEGSSTGDPNYNAIGDFDSDGDIDFDDFVRFAGVYDTQCS